MEKELILKAKKAENPEELAALAKANGMAMTAEEAKAYFAQLHPAASELSDDELDNVAGGGCQANDGRLELNKDLTINGRLELNKDLTTPGRNDHKK